MHKYELISKLKKRVHLNIGKVSYFDTKHNEWFEVYLEVFGNGYLYKNIQDKIYHEDLLNIYYVISIEIIEENNDFVKINYGETLFMMNTLQKNKLLKHINRVNNLLVKKQLPFRKDVQSITNEIRANIDISKYLLGFFNNTPIYYFYDFLSIRSLEEYLFTKSNLGTSFFKISNKTLGYGSIEHSTDYAPRYFLDFLNLIKSKYNCSNVTLLPYSVYELITSFETPYFSNIIISKFNDTFDNLQDSSIEETLRLYYNNSLEPLNNDMLYCFTHYLEFKGIMNPDILNNYAKIKSIIIDIDNENRLKHYENKLLTYTKSDLFKIEDTDLLSGYAFESLVTIIFKKLGYDSYKTKSTGDQGIDIICSKNGYKIGVQAKCYSSRVTNTAIQEVVAGMAYYGCNRGIVVTNSYFTKSANELAISNNIILWDRKILEEKLNDLNITMSSI